MKIKFTHASGYLLGQDRETDNDEGLFCPQCGNQSVWFWDHGDCETPTSYVCLSCKHSFGYDGYEEWGDEKEELSRSVSLAYQTGREDLTDPSLHERRRVAEKERRAKMTPEQRESEDMMNRSIMGMAIYMLSPIENPVTVGLRSWINRDDDKKKAT